MAIPSVVVLGMGISVVGAQRVGITVMTTGVIYSGLSAPVEVAFWTGAPRL